ncbi:MAG: flagellar motor switch protein FliG [bacterium]|nr:flagellar motor switch protein FliG [bacterium]MCP5067350.1 flagellar motor switch protein FliG [bacterium]
MEFETLTGAEKVGIVILSMPKDKVTDYLGQLSDEEVEKALSAVSRMEKIPPRIQKLVMSEFQESIGQQDTAITGGRETAMAIVENGLGEGRAAEILEKLGQDEQRIDWTLRSYQPTFICDRIQDEHPQTIALILSQIPADRGAIVINSLPDAIQPEVVLRLASMQPVATDIMSDLEIGVAELFRRRKVSTTRAGGTKAAANMLNRVPKEEGTTILDGIDMRDSEVAIDIRKRMLTFEDLQNIDKRGFQTFLREVSTEDLAVAMKTASEEMQEKIFSNLSSRAVDQIKEEIDLLGPMKLAEVETVQEQIVDVARRLEAEGRLSIELGGSDDVLV